jgi:hypothetical protein
MRWGWARSSAALVDSLGWRPLRVNIPIGRRDRVHRAVRARVHAARARRFDPVGQALVMRVGQSLRDHRVQQAGLDSVLGLLAVAVLGVLGIPLRAVPCRPAAGAALVSQRAVQRGDRHGALGLCAFGAFLFVTTLYRRTCAA